MSDTLNAPNLDTYANIQADIIWRFTQAEALGINIADLTQKRDEVYSRVEAIFGERLEKDEPRELTDGEVAQLAQFFEELSGIVNELDRVFSLCSYYKRSLGQLNDLAAMPSPPTKVAIGKGTGSKEWEWGERFIRYAASERADILAKSREAFDSVLKSIKERDFTCADTYMDTARRFVSYDLWLRVHLHLGNLVEVKETASTAAK
jgi:hypothetical protein